MIARLETLNPGMYNWGAVNWSEGYRNIDSELFDLDIAWMKLHFLKIDTIKFELWTQQKISV